VREGSRERKKDNRSLFFIDTRKRIQVLARGLVCGLVARSGLVSILVFYYIHTSIWACLHGLNATNEVVMLFPPFFSTYQLLPITGT
jgi:hypothetical protein